MISSGLSLVSARVSANRPSLVQVNMNRSESAKKKKKKKGHGTDAQSTASTTTSRIECGCGCGGPGAAPVLHRLSTCHDHININNVHVQEITFCRDFN